MIAVACAVVSASEAAGFWGALRPGPYAVGFRHFTVEDDTRISTVVNESSGEVHRKYFPREIKIYLWYPAKEGGTAAAETLKLYIQCFKSDFALKAEGGANKPTVLMNFPLGKGADENYIRKILAIPVSARRDAEPAAGRFPVVVFGQGYYYESPLTHFFLCEYLASRGYIVITFPLAGLRSPAANLTPEDLETQVRDMEFVLSAALRLPYAEQGKAAAAGFDLGGLSAALLAMRNPLVRAVVSMDAGLIFRHNLDLMAQTGRLNPGGMRAPLLHFTRPAAENEAMGVKEDYSLWNGVASETMLMARIPSMSHADFTSYALFESRQPVPGYWDAPLSGIAEKHRAVCRAIGDFLDAVMKDDGKKASFGGEQLKSIFSGIPVTVESRVNGAQRFTADDFLALVYGGKSGAACAMAKEAPASNPSADFLQEAFLNGLGYRLLYFSGDPKEAVDIFKLNAEIHPESSNSYDSLGEAYLVLGDNDLAIVNYKKSLALNPKNDNARKILEQIEKK